jgi:hypothetical protein
MIVNQIPPHRDQRRTTGAALSGGGGAVANLGRIIQTTVLLTDFPLRPVASSDGIETVTDPAHFGPRLLVRSEWQCRFLRRYMLAAGRVKC